jgi:hypothetical protein
MIDIILYTLLAIIIIVIICILAYYIADYLDNKKDTDAKFNKTSDYINKNFHNIDNELIDTTNYINRNLINVNKNIKISDTNLTTNMNKINNDLTTNMSKINNDLLDNIVNTSNVLTNNIINTSNIFSDQIKNNDKKFDNINDNLSRYFSFSSATDTNYLLNEHLLSDISTAKLNVLTQVNFNSDLRVCDKTTPNPNCVKLNIDGDKNFNITPEGNNMQKLIIKGNAVGTAVPAPIASFDLKNNSIYLGSDNDSNAAMFIKNNNVYIKQLNLVGGDSNRLYSSLTSTSDNIKPLNYANYNNYSLLETEINTLRTGLNSLKTSVSSITLTDSGVGYTELDLLDVEFVKKQADPSTNIIPAQATVNLIDDDTVGTIVNGTNSKKVGSITLTNPGLNYTLPPDVIIKNRFQAREGLLVKIIVTNGGRGYKTDTPPTITIVGNGISTDTTTATATANITNGVITSIDINPPGQIYTAIPTVRIDPPPSKVIETGTASIRNGSITAINIDNIGRGYLPNSTVKITIGIPNTTDNSVAETQATATAAVNANGTIGNINITNAGSGYVSLPSITFPQPNGLDNIPATATAIIRRNATATASLNSAINF